VEEPAVKEEDENPEEETRKNLAFLLEKVEGCSVRPFIMHVTPITYNTANVSPFSCCGGLLSTTYKFNTCTSIAQVYHMFNINTSDVGRCSDKTEHHHAKLKISFE
jgi:cell envelope opacity-associated protein A